MKEISEQEILCCLALNNLPSIGPLTALRLYKTAGSASSILEHSQDICSIMPDAQPAFVEIIKQMPTYVDEARRELDFIQKYQIQCLCYKDEDYPMRLKECEDAPLLLFCKGNIQLNVQHVVCVVGTRICTEYGRDFCRHFMEDLSLLMPDTLIVSGLAYGIDINAHVRALENNLPTVAVLAHGLDRIYPYAHRTVAKQMIESGGLVTEYPSLTNPDPYNFVRRNRIVAGLSDACVVVESREKGGSLITAELANGYNREVFAVPGRVFDSQSVGCNHLIQQNMAILLNEASDFLEYMRWTDKKKKTIQRELFPELTPDQQILVKALQGKEEVSMNTLIEQTGFPVQKTTMLLLEMEMKGLVKPLAGLHYRLLD